MTGEAGAGAGPAEDEQAQGKGPAPGDSALRQGGFFDAINEGFCIIEVLFDDHERAYDCRFLELNRSFERQTGLTGAKGRRMRELMPVHEQHWYDIYGHVALTGEPACFRNLVKALGRFYDVFAFRTGAPQQRRVALLFNDVTVGEKAEAALYESVGRGGTVFVTAREGIVYTKPGGAFLYVNRRFADMLGYDGREIVGKPYTDFYFSGERLRSFGIHCNPKKGCVKQGEQRFRRKDGAELWVAYNAATVYNRAGEHVANMALCTDITEQKKAARALRESEAKYQRLFETANDGFWWIDSRGLITEVNEGLAKMLGYSAAELAGKSWADFIKEDFFVREQPGQTGRKARKTVHQGIKMRKKNGDSLWARVNSLPLWDGEGKFAGYLSAFTDITEQKLAEEALRRSEEELRRADHAKNNFISMLSHELRNPLAAITAGVSLLEISGDNRAQLERVRGIIKRQSNQLCKLVDDLLDLTRLTMDRIELRRENTDLCDLVMNAAGDMKSVFGEKEIHFAVAVPEKPLLLHADPVRITQSIGNLLHNALKYTPEGGTVRLSVRQEPGRAVVVVEDNGAGISQELLPDLFKPFAQADISLDRKNNGGLGLGLSIARGMVEMHGGTISAESEGPGRGSLFTILLPVTIDRAGAPEGGPAEAGSAGIRKILVIEDSEEQAELLCSLLNELGHEAFAAHDGGEGIARARQTAPDIIFCDIGLPGMNGYEVAQTLKADEALGKTVLVSLTGYADEASIRRARESGFDRHMAKPVSLAALQQLLGERRS